jgi:hypothetical protein
MRLAEFQWNTRGSGDRKDESLSFAVGHGFLFCSTRQAVRVGVDIETLVPGEAHQAQHTALGQY